MGSHDKNHERFYLSRRFWLFFALLVMLLVTTLLTIRIVSQSCYQSFKEECQKQGIPMDITDALALVPKDLDEGRQERLWQLMKKARGIIGKDSGFYESLDIYRKSGLGIMLKDVEKLCAVTEISDFLMELNGLLQEGPVYVSKLGYLRQDLCNGIEVWAVRSPNVYEVRSITNWIILFAMTEEHSEYKQLLLAWEKSMAHSSTLIDVMIGMGCRRKIVSFMLHETLRGRETLQQEKKEKSEVEYAADAFSSDRNLFTGVMMEDFLSKPALLVEEYGVTESALLWLFGGIDLKHSQQIMLEAEACLRGERMFLPDVEGHMKSAYSSSLLGSIGNLLESGISAASQDINNNLENLTAQMIQYWYKHKQLPQSNDEFKLLPFCKNADLQLHGVGVVYERLPDNRFRISVDSKGDVSKYAVLLELGKRTNYSGMNSHGKNPETVEKKKRGGKRGSHPDNIPAPVYYLRQFSKEVDCSRLPLSLDEMFKAEPGKKLRTEK